MVSTNYVAEELLQDIQIDLAIFTDSSPANNGYKYAFVAVGIFTKICCAVPTKGKKPAESSRAVMEALTKQVFHNFYTMIMRARGAVLNLYGE